MKSTFNIYNTLTEMNYEHEFWKNKDLTKILNSCRQCPEITCVLIEYVNQGIDNYELFSKILKIKYKTLKKRDRKIS